MDLSTLRSAAPFDRTLSNLFALIGLLLLVGVVGITLSSSLTLHSGLLSWSLLTAEYPSGASPLGIHDSEAVLSTHYSEVKTTDDWEEAFTLEDESGNRVSRITGRDAEMDALYLVRYDHGEVHEALLLYNEEVYIAKPVPNATNESEVASRTAFSHVNNYHYDPNTKIFYYHEPSGLWGGDQDWASASRFMNRRILDGGAATALNYVTWTPTAEQANGSLTFSAGEYARTGFTGSPTGTMVVDTRGRVTHAQFILPNSSNGQDTEATYALSTSPDAPPQIIQDLYTFAKRR